MDPKALTGAMRGSSSSCVESSRKPRLSTTRGYTGVKDIDIDFSRELYTDEKGRRKSAVTMSSEAGTISTVGDFRNIPPKSSTVDYRTAMAAGKKVRFKPIVQSKSEKSSQSPISHESQYSLQRFGAYFGSYEHALRNVWSTLSTSSSIRLSDTETSMKGTPSFVGQIHRVGASKLMPSSVIVKNGEINPSPSDNNLFDSTIPGVGLSSSVSFANPNSVWPWPWIHPDERQSSDYVASEQQKVTFSQQKQLPKSTVPLLAHTLKGYLDSVKPYVTPIMYTKTQELVKEFAIGCGQTYNEKLLEIVQGHADWHKVALPNYTHLFSRQEQCLQNIPTVVALMDDLWPPTPNSMIERASELIQLTLEFLVQLSHEEIKPMKNDNNHNQCMHAFKKLFSSCRIPGIPQDGIATFFQIENEDAMPKHIIVIYRSNIFAVDVLRDGQATIGKALIKENLKRIVQFVEESKEGTALGLGVLTSADRNTWAMAREKIMHLSEDNAKFMLLIEQAICVISLDHVNARPTHICHEAVFADGCNRWYDKGLAFYVHSNGLITANVNRSMMERWPVAVLLDYIHLRVVEEAEKWDDGVAKSMSKDLQHEPPAGTSEIFGQLKAIYSAISNSVFADEDEEGVITISADDNDDVAEVLDDWTELRELPFELDADLEEMVEKTKGKFSLLSQAMSTAVCEYPMLESGLLKRLDIQPDAFAHIVIQLTFYRMYFRMPSMGTRVNTSTFYHGRYDVMRPVTLESLELCKLMTSNDADQAAKVNAFWAAEKKHRFMVNRATNDRGFEHHMTALKLIAEEMDEVIPDVFLDESYVLSGGNGRFQIYTESINGFNNNFLSKPVVLPTHASGYGVGYVIDKSNTKLVFCVSSWGDDKTTSAQLFASSLHRTLELHHDFFVNSLGSETH